jgi:hypothetical protein
MDAGPGRNGGTGKILGSEWVDTLAIAASVGIDPVAISRADPVLRALLIDVAEAGVRRQAERDEALARRIIAALADSLKRGRNR